MAAGVVHLRCCSSFASVESRRPTNAVAVPSVHGSSHLQPLRSPRLSWRSQSAAVPSFSSARERHRCPLTPRASVDSTDYTVEPTTNVSFPRELKVPGSSDSLVLLGTGYREKVFAIIGVKVYAAGFYVSHFMKEKLMAWRGKSAADLEGDSSLFSRIHKEPIDKSLRIELVRDVDGKTFWNALNEAILPRVKEPTTVDKSAISTFQKTFQGRDLRKGTFIYLTWAGSSKMLVSISSEASPSNVDAEIESLNVTLALYDAFLGDSPVSPTLKASVADGLTLFLN